MIVYIRQILLVLSLLLAAGCSWDNVDTASLYQLPSTYQPIYITRIDNFKDSSLIHDITQIFQGYDIAITTDKAQANSILQLSKISRQTNKAVTNNVANNQSIFYKSHYTATVSVSFPHQPSRTPLKKTMSTHTPVILLENQNIFSASDTEQIFQELQNDLSKRIVREIVFSLNPPKSLRTPPKKTI